MTQKNKHLLPSPAFTLNTSSLFLTYQLTATKVVKMCFVWWANTEPACIRHAWWDRLTCEICSQSKQGRFLTSKDIFKGFPLPFKIPYWADGRRSQCRPQTPGRRGCTPALQPPNVNTAPASPPAAPAQLHLPLAESFLVLIIFAAYSWPVDFLTHRRTTEKAPLRGKNQETIPCDESGVFLDRVLSSSYSRDVHQLQRN